jgi:hypothetical protein
VLAFGLRPLDMAIMPVAPQPSVGIQPVGPNRAPGFDRLGDETVQGALGQIWDTPHPHPADACAVFLRRHDDQGLFFYQPTDDALFLAATVCFVHLDNSTQSISTGTHHGSRQLVEQGPGRPVAAQPQGRASQRGQMNPSGQRRWKRYSLHASTSAKRCSSSMSVRG